MSELKAQTDQAAKATTGLRTIGDEVSRGWTQAKSEISGLEGGLGKGKLGEAFMRTYKPSANSLDQPITQTSGVPTQLAEAARHGLTDYVSTDDQMCHSFESIGN